MQKTIATPDSSVKLTSTSTDENLIKSIAAGDQTAMRILYTRNYGRVLRFITRFVKDAGRAEDLVNEVFIGAWNGSLPGPFAGPDPDPVDCPFQIPDGPLASLRRRTG